jgi:hypothetical protein
MLRDVAKPLPKSQAEQVHSLLSSRGGLKGQVEVIPQQVETPQHTHTSHGYECGCEGCVESMQQVHIA